MLTFFLLLIAVQNVVAIGFADKTQYNYTNFILFFLSGRAITIYTRINFRMRKQEAVKNSYIDRYKRRALWLQWHYRRRQ